ncbi:MAG: hypothetical protein HN411_03585 [Waddliaceae bacterium]|jgi:4-amino-4-deoxy-L-arabinose transferase-like glycosyltransferase|nr:hypothetical protein [Waddliaceae bacterium]MBT3579587.1 hypothetical protein [Waddliaceae bacterium]MBT4444449.1 hypothetical protein [Waddliaceae bacterium]MBT6928194.1 hypothetical protein [Waddliaceae bacterium]MBT7264339.1 hypothetical protein [Waddliaceae bacterium]
MDSLQERRSGVWFLTALALIVVIKGFWAIWMINFTSIDLNPDEVQYWLWSRNLDIGYYSKAPGIAWQIWAGCKIFGNTEMGVRFFAVIISALLSLSTYFTARCCGVKAKVAFWAGIAIAFSPMGFISSFAAATDGGFILFWLLTCAYLCYCLRYDHRPKYHVVGFLIAFGAIFKWPQIYYLWGMIVVFALCYPILRTKRMLGGMVVSLLGLVPSIIWNASNEWATFRHVYGQITGSGGGGGAAGNTAEFLGTQAGILSPILFVVMLLALVHMVRKRKETPLSILFCGWTTLSLLLLAIARSFMSKVQGNWFIFAYPTAFVLMSWYVFERAKAARKWFFAGIALSVVFTLFVLAIPAIQKYDVITIPYKYNGFQHSMGWDKLEGALEEAGYNPDKDFLFSEKYQTTSIMSFYAKNKKRAYFFNVGNARKNQYSFWPGMDDEQTGNDGFFVLIENGRDVTDDVTPRVDHYTKLLSPYFSSIDFIDAKTLFIANGTTVKRAVIFRCTEYNGSVPLGVNKY